MTRPILTPGTSTLADTTELSEADHRELCRFGAYLRAAMVQGQEAAYELVYGESVPRREGRSLA